ncbi:unnamed protein product [Blepharisma stoltei]|uniref:Uncharacterized protein n=1 Tax=Blepharisma stoltei TaxID=1481888 RepID=A0AAU9JD26_9CILI|nr:unnamed protein product [Blepharisma stoltei]
MSEKLQERTVIDMKTKVGKAGCAGTHAALDLCLKNNGNDWRQCQNELVVLGKCMRLSIKAEEKKIN